MKIIQFQAMPNDAHWQGSTLCLCDDGNLYIQDFDNGCCRLVLYATAADVKITNRPQMKKDLINIINHAAFNIYTDSGEPVKVVDMQDVVEIIEEEI